MDIRVEETNSKRVLCPCGCRQHFEQHNGVLHFSHGGAYFGVALMLHENTERDVWLSIASLPPAGDDDRREWLVTLHADSTGARAEDPDSSPVNAPTFDGRRITRDELLARQSEADFYFSCFDALLAQHSRLFSFLFVEADV